MPRRAGVIIPLFAFPSTRSWGIGEIGDIEPLAAWLHTAGLSLIQFLPVNEMGSAQHSPYSAVSAMAIDPIYISVYAVEDFVALGGERALDGSAGAVLDIVRAARAVDYRRVRSLKMQALEASFERFLNEEWRRGTERARSLVRFITEQNWWLADHALFRAIRALDEARPWTSWSQGLKSRDPAMCRQARGWLAKDILFSQYLQWVADQQWHAARRAAAPVLLFGDFPFTVAADSADVWARQDEFDLNATVGTPPDAFSATGQDWQSPAYRWDVVASHDFGWLRDRARRCAALYDGYRVDHVVGFYRTYVRPADGEPFFTPEEEPEQIRLGERVLGICAASGSRVIAEDLGTVPPFVRASLARLGIPGFRVLRWERDWEVDGTPFRDPRSYPPLSVATSGTHDTAPLAVWWSEASPEDRRRLGRVPGLERLGIDGADATYRPALRDGILEVLYESGSDLLVLPVQDVFGWSDRINIPAVVSEGNWSFRLPWPADRLDAQPEARERAAALRRFARRYGRMQKAEWAAPSNR